MRGLLQFASGRVVGLWAIHLCPTVENVEGRQSYRTEFIWPILSLSGQGLRSTGLTMTHVFTLTVVYGEEAEAQGLLIASSVALSWMCVGRRSSVLD